MLTEVFRQTALEVVEKALAEAQSAHDHAAQQLATAQAEVEGLTQQIRAGDPDDAGAIDALAQQRASAQARVEALGTRVDERLDALHQALEEVEPHRLAHDEEQLAQLSQRAKALSAELDAQVEEAAAALIERAKQLRALQREGSVLRDEITQCKGHPQVYGPVGFGVSYLGPAGPLDALIEQLGAALTRAWQGRR